MPDAVSYTHLDVYKRQGLTNVVVKVNGQEVTGSVSLEAGTYPVEVTADEMCIRDRNRDTLLNSA